MIQLGPDKSYPLKSEIFFMHKLQTIKVTSFPFTVAVCGMATKTNKKQQKRQNKKACKMASAGRQEYIMYKLKSPLRVKHFRN